MSKIFSIAKNFKISVGDVHKMPKNTELVVSYQWYDNKHCANGRTTRRWLHDGRTEILEMKTTKEPKGFFRGAYEGRKKIYGATYAVCFYEKIEHGVILARRKEIYVWPNYNVKRLRETLRRPWRSRW